MRPQDQAEALEAVQGEVVWKHRHQEEDDDVDMIPLIDVSLVLLIFFMLVSTGVGAAAFVPTPGTDYGDVVNNPESVSININLEGENRTPIFALGKDNQFAAEDSELRSVSEALSHLDTILRGRGSSQVVINAHKDLKAGVVRDLITELERKSRRDKIREIRIGVSEK
jgi:biopolymer transport protein ExbD